MPAFPLTAAEIAALTADVQQLVGVGASVVWHVRGERTYTPGAGTYTYDDTEVSLTCWGAAPTQREIAGGAGVDDRIFLVSAALVTPTVDDRVEEGAATWTVYKIETDALGAHHRCWCRRADG